MKKTLSCRTQTEDSPHTRKQRCAHVLYRIDFKPPACSGSSQEKRPISVQVWLKFHDALGEKLGRYVTETCLRREKRQENHGELAKEFAKYGINYSRDIYPPFNDAYLAFISTLASKKAMIETIREYEKWWKRYQLPVRLLARGEVTGWLYMQRPTLTKEQGELLAIEISDVTPEVVRQKRETLEKELKRPTYAHGTQGVPGLCAQRSARYFTHAATKRCPSSA